MNQSQPCFECGNSAHHQHHVVPRSLGGTKTLPLCVECHSKIHGLNLLSPRLIKAGIARAKAAGKHWGGRKPGSLNIGTAHKQDLAQKLSQQGLSITDISRQIGMTRQTVYRLLSKAQAQN